MEKYWEVKKLHEMTSQEWENLCDGCAKCCLHKLEDEETGNLYYTAVACNQLNLSNCQCKTYEDRFSLVPDCLKVELSNSDIFPMLPESCAYRRLSEGKKLEDWHPLNSGNQESVISHGISILGKAFSEDEVAEEDFENYMITFEEEK